MKRTFITLLAVLAVMIASTISAQDPASQGRITLANKGINIGGDGMTFPGRVDACGFDGIYMTNGGCSLTIDFKAPQVAISGSRNCVRFYDNVDKTYNAVRCSYFRTMSDSCLKYDVRPLSADETFRSLAAAPTVASEISASVTTKNEDISLLDELKSRFPSLVRYDDNGMALVNYVEILPLLVRQIQDAGQELDDIRREVELLKSELQ